MGDMADDSEWIRPGRRNRENDRKYQGDEDRSRDRSRSNDGDRHRRRNDRPRADRHDDSDSGGEDHHRRNAPRSSYGGGVGGGGNSYGGGNTGGHSNNRGRWNDSVPNNILLIRGLPEDAIESDIMDELSKAGLSCKEVRIMRSKDSGSSLRYCFVEFNLVAEAQYWMELNQGEMRFRDTFSLNMYYSTTRRGNLHHSSSTPVDQGLVDQCNVNGLSDWICIKCSSTNFQRRTHCRRCNQSREESDRVHSGDGLDQVGSNPCNTLVLRGLDGLTTEENIINAFAAITTYPIKNVRVIRDYLTGVSNGYAYVEMTSLRESKEFVDYLEQLKCPLEVDGKAIIVSYSKNTFTTALSTLELQKQSVQQQSQQNYYDYSAYYYQQAVQANAVAAAGGALSQVNSTNAAAAVAQAAIMAQQKKQSIIQGSPTVTAPAMLRKHGGEVAAASGPTAEYTIYPVPDVSTYTYDETSGYYYDASTGLYYDPNTQYYYNTEAQAFMYWDGEKQTYLPATTTTDAATTAAAVLAQDLNKEEEDKKKATPVDDKKVKVAKKIVKDMEKWAKKLNAQKEAQKDEIKKLINFSSVAQATGAANQQNPSAGADAGFSLLEKTVNKTQSEPRTKEAVASFVPPPPTQQQTAIFKSESASASGAEVSCSTKETGGGGAVTEEELTDWVKLTCLLCRRAFPSKEVLIKHQQMSELHKTNLDDLIKSRGGGVEDSLAQSLQYRDRAKERREKYGLPEPPQPKRKEKTVEAVEPVPFEQPTVDGIKDDNIGFKLAKKMGWKDGMGLGRTNQGIVDPIEAKQRQASAGLGARGSSYNIDTSGTYKDRARKTFQAYFQEIN